MIIITGAAGFIGSHVARHFGKKAKLLLVDDPEHFRERGYFGPAELTMVDWSFGVDSKEQDFKIIDREYLPKILGVVHKQANPDNPKAKENVLLPPGEKIELVIHLGACTNTAEFRKDFLQKWNVDYSKSIWNWCAREQVPLIYASSAATYGNGEQGFSDSWETALKLKPMNPYGQSKQDFDHWVHAQLEADAPTPPHWYGVKFFNVYGPQESHKNTMISPVLRAYRQIQRTGACTLFRSHNPKVKDGEQKRDFIHVNDIVSILDFLAFKLPASGLYNNGTGKARTFYSMMEALFSSLGRPMKIDWIDTPEQYRKAYQYFTQARMEKLLDAGYRQPFLSLEEGVASYVAWLQKNEPEPPVETQINPKNYH